VLGVVLAGAAATLAVAFTLRATRERRSLVLVDVASLEKKLRTGSDADVEGAIRDTFGDAAPAMLAAVAANDDASLQAGAVALDEHLGEIDRELSGRKGVAGAAVRIALLSAALGAVLELLQDLGQMIAALVAVVIGVGVAGACFELGRNAVRRTAKLRADWDRVAAAAAARLGMPLDGSLPVTRGSSGVAAADQRRRRRRGS
jgi:hypothetical protein